MAPRSEGGPCEGGMDMEWMLMPLRRYADFSGRSRRMEFWMWQVFKFAVVIAFMLLMTVLGGAALISANGDPGAMMAAGGIVMILYLVLLLFGLAIIIPDIAVSVRRLHDTNRTGWWILAPVAPYIVVFLAAGVAVSSPDMAGAASVIGFAALIATLGLAVTLLVFYFLEGTRGPNRYGPDPKGANTGEVFA